MHDKIHALTTSTSGTKPLPLTTEQEAVWTPEKTLTFWIENLWLPQNERQLSDSAVHGTQWRLNHTSFVVTLHTELSRFVHKIRCENVDPEWQEKNDLDSWFIAVLYWTNTEI
jgi:hypothetical protein